MKTQFYNLSIAIVFLLSLFSACKKQEPLIKGAPEVISLQINGITTTEIEIIYQGKVILTQPANDGGFVQTVQLPISGQDDEIQIREKGSTNIIVTKKVKPSPFNQTLFYKDRTVYDRRVSLNILGYATSGELEFVVDEEILGEGSMIISQSHAIYFNDGDKKELEVRIKGETGALIKRNLNTPEDTQSLSFFFDGILILDQIPALTPPKDPNNMSITATFSSRYAAIGSMPVFTGDREVDIVFFPTDGSGVAIKTNPEIRITVPTDGLFVTFELPPPPDGLSYAYDIYKKGSTDLPYKDFDLSGGKIVLNEGRVGYFTFPDANGNNNTFEAGSSKLLLLQEEVQGFNAFPPDYSENFTVVYGFMQDLSQYFQ